VGRARCEATTYAEQHNTEKLGNTSMPRARFEPTIPVFERLRTVRALDSTATGTGIIWEPYVLKTCEESPCWGQWWDESCLENITYWVLLLKDINESEQWLGTGFDSQTAHGLLPHRDRTTSGAEPVCQMGTEVS